MNPVKEQIRSRLKLVSNLPYMIKIKPLDRELRNKKLFIDTLSLLTSIEERSIKLEEEEGVSLTRYEDDFYEVIHNLFMMLFNDAQFALLQLYYTSLVSNAEWDGTISLKVRNKESTHNFRTPEEVWNVLKLLEKTQ